MATTIQIKRGTGSAVPSGLADGELAINLDNGKLFFGSGSTSINSFRFENLTAENYIVSSSVTNITTQELSGSTNFGDTADDTHTFTGAITASGNISASGTIKANSFTGNGLSIDGSSNSHIEVGEYPVGYDNLGLNTLYITGSGLIISGAMADANHHNMLKIGNVELLDLNTAVSTNEFLIHNVNSFKITSGSDGGDVAHATNDIFVHNGTAFFICKGGELANTSNATIASSDTTTTIQDTDIILNAANGPAMRALNSTTSTYIAGFSSNPHSNASQNIQSILASNFFPLVGGAVTASAVSSSGNIYAEDFWDNGVNIKDIYANQNVTGSYALTSSLQELIDVTGSYAITGSDVIFNHVTASGNISSSGEVKAASFRLGNGAFIIASNGDITTSNDLVAGNSTTADVHILTGRTTLNGNITASGNISASGIIYASSFDNVIATNITASGIISASGGITASGFIGTTISAKRRNFTVPTDTAGLHDGDVVYFGGTTSMTTGAIYHYKSDGTWELADADAVATSDGLLGVALGAASNTNGVLLRGIVTLDHDAGAIGDVLYLSTTAGDCAATAPSGTNDVVRIVGYKIFHATKKQVWFNPSSDFIIHA